MRRIESVKPQSGGNSTSARTKVSRIGSNGIKSNLEIVHLKNGITVITDPLRSKHVRSAAISVSVGVGAADEDQKDNGIAHFVEHILFKRTKNRTTKEIMGGMSNVGADINAETSYESTSYYAQLLGEKIDVPTEIYLDMMFNHKHNPDDFELERKVILEESTKYDDELEERVRDLSTLKFHSGSPYGRLVIGSQKSIKALNPSSVSNFLNKFYVPDNIVVSLAGNFDHERSIRLIEKLTEHVSRAPYSTQPKNITYKPGVYVEDRNLNQTHFTLAVRAYSHYDKKIYALEVLNEALGGDVSSRLFEEIREKRGLAYRVNSSFDSYRDGGVITIYAGTRSKAFTEVMKIIRDELIDIKENGLTYKEIERAKLLLKTKHLLANETSLLRAQFNAEDYVTYRKIIPSNEVIASIEGVTSSDIIEVANDLFKEDQSALTIIGPKKKLLKQIGR